ncbi:unnamed protein product [Didymodactylos carnosus]|uniref:Uncharacterized protein n=1 Tax=Didymodactylos carnosus TaxID=1234261 RepID=A0A8S2FVI8_9BILA|nr:unnamed protein product [Didymodactylos carnosus]CAF4362512.1 unnamed protein product [Didymodactylos carnosus]
MYLLKTSCSEDHVNCKTILYPLQEYDLNSSIGQCIRLYHSTVYLSCESKGKLISILPGQHEIICRIKLDKNEEYVLFRNEEYAINPNKEKRFRCYFYAVAEYGLDCQCDGNKLNYDWFKSNYLLYSNQNWFNQTIDKIIVYKILTTLDLQSNMNIRIVIFYLIIYN